ncbi:unnamed protein product [Arctia plantaginis]|uniref:Uncharacterized protein n=1 Tax=Arctia plantaginis TaxID=874455 RepID=A0A8S0ZR40_ARCPL|nr:unnamed protein product [Arctia plantaginis]
MSSSFKCSLGRRSGNFFDILPFGVAPESFIVGYGIIPLKIPSSPATHCTLHTTVGCVGNDECTAKSHSVIRLLGPVRDVIVRPARHHYRPGETSE